MRRLLACLALACAASAHAHKPSDSYLAVRVSPEGISGQWDIALRDLEYAIGLDADGDGAITWGEVRARHQEIASYALARLALRAGGRACRLSPTAHLVDRHSDGAYAVLRFAADCAPRAAEAVEVQYALFFDLDPTHRGLLRAERDGGISSGVLAPERPRLSIEAAPRSAWAQFLDYAREGIWHIWIGIDHVLFLLSLLLPSVLLWRAPLWQPAARFAPVFWDVVKVVTSFTLAHSITLSLAALSVIELPSRLVESGIAASVVVAALNNLRPMVLGRRWLVAFAFGLVHGFGFASVLADLGLPRDALLLALVSFNLGVEGGQLVLVSAFLPLAFALRRTRLYRRALFTGGSALIALVAAVWMVERMFELRLLDPKWLGL
jgi:hypothetical protein